MASPGVQLMWTFAVWGAATIPDSHRRHLFQSYLRRPVSHCS
jgi:hypothetical protein